MIKITPEMAQTLKEGDPEMNKLMEKAIQTINESIEALCEHAKTLPPQGQAEVLGQICHALYDSRVRISHLGVSDMSQTSELRHTKDIIGHTMFCGMYFTDE